MPTIIVKANQKDDLYCLWSSVVDAPTVIGTRDEILQFIDAQYGLISLDENRRRLDRADKYGSSSMIGEGLWDSNGWICRWTWHDGTMKETGAMWLDRVDLTAFLRQDNSVLIDLETANNSK